MQPAPRSIWLPYNRLSADAGSLTTMLESRTCTTHNSHICAPQPGSARDLATTQNSGSGFVKPARSSWLTVTAPALSGDVAVCGRTELLRYQVVTVTL